MHLDHTEASVLLWSHASAQTKPVLCCSVQPGPSSGRIPTTRGGQGCPCLRASVCSGCRDGSPGLGAPTTHLSHSSGCRSARSRCWRGRSPSETWSHGWGRPPARCAHMTSSLCDRETVNELWSLLFLQGHEPHHGVPLSCPHLTLTPKGPNSKHCHTGD